jgi:hypothetical protein
MNENVAEFKIPGLWKLSFTSFFFEINVEGIAHEIDKESPF